MPHSPPRHQYAHQKANRKQQQKEYNRTRRENQSFYNSTQWKKVREWFRKQNPLCVMCEAEGLTTPTQIVDHIVEIKDGGAPLDASNLQSLCIRHHNVKTAQARSDRAGAG